MNSDKNNSSMISSADERRAFQAAMNEAVTEDVARILSGVRERVAARPAETVNTGAVDLAEQLMREGYDIAAASREAAHLHSASAPLVRAALELRRSAKGFGVIAPAADEPEFDPGQDRPCPGHKWAYTGTAYGGDDESYRGEGRVYCEHCDADGDA